jgi:hypothetical protein
MFRRFIASTRASNDSSHDSWETNRSIGAIDDNVSGGWLIARAMDIDGDDAATEDADCSILKVLLNRSPPW